MVLKRTFISGGSTATGPASQGRQGRQFAKTLPNLRTRFFRAGMWMSCFCLWFAAASLPAWISGLALAFARAISEYGSVTSG